MNGTVKDWRDEVSMFIGKTEAKLDEIHRDVKDVKGCTDKNDKRIASLEKKETEKNAIKKFASGLWAIIGGLIVYLLQRFIKL